MVPLIARTKGLVDGTRQQVNRKFQAIVGVIVLFQIYFCITQLFASHISRRWWQVILGTVVLGTCSLCLLPMSRRRKRQPLQGAEAAGGATVAVARAPSRDTGGMAMLGHLDFWLFIQGGGLMYISNTPQIIKAYAGGASDDAIASLCAVVSVFNSFARLAFGNLSEALAGRVHRTHFLVAALSALALGCACDDPVS